MAENNFYPTNRIALDSTIVFKPLLDVRASVQNYADLNDLNYWTVNGTSYLNEGQVTYVVTGDTTHPSGLYVCVNKFTPVWERVGGSFSETQVQITSDGTISSSDYQSKADGVYVASENITGVADKGDVVVVSSGTFTKLNLNGGGVNFSSSSAWTGLVGYNGNNLVKTDLNKDVLLTIGNEAKQYLGHLTIVDDSDTVLYDGIVGNKDTITLNDVHIDEAVTGEFFTATYRFVGEDDFVDISLNILSATDVTSNALDVYDSVDTLIPLTISYTHIRELPASANHSHNYLAPHQFTVTFPEGHVKSFESWNASSLNLSEDAPSIEATFAQAPTNWTTSDIVWEDISHIYFNGKKVIFIYNDADLKAGWYNKNLLVIKPSDNKISWYIIDPKNVTTVSFSTFAPIADVIPLWTTNLDGTKRLYVTSSEYIEYYEQA